MIKMQKKFLIFLFLFFSLPIVSCCQTQFDKAIKYAVGDFNSVLKKERTRWVSNYSNIEPVTFTGNLTGLNQEDLVVVLNSHNYHVGIGIIYAFRFEKERIHLIYKKRAFEVSASIVAWKKRNALLVALGNFNDGRTDSIADILVYKNKEFVSVLQFPWESSVIQLGYYNKAQVISSDNDQIQIIAYNNELKYEEGKPTCTKASIQTYFWDEETFSFKKGKIKNLVKNDLDNILLNNKLKFPYEMRDLCQSSDSETQTDHKIHKEVLPAIPPN